MAMKHLLTLAQRHSSPNQTVRSASSASAVAAASVSTAPAATPLPPPPHVMPYDNTAEIVKSKLERLENPDPRFLKYGSPHPTLASHKHILLLPETRVTTLPNGLRVATESNLAARTATVGVWVDAGSRFETDETNGTAYYLEQMIFKGTGRRTVKNLEEEIEAIGGHLNAYTSSEQSTVYAKVMDKDVNQALDVLADILQNPKLEEGRMYREREVILRAMREHEGHTDEVILDHLHATAFQCTPLGRTIQVIAAAGAVKHEVVVDQVKKLFTKLPADPTTTSQLVAKEPAMFTGSEVWMINDDLPMAYFSVAFEGASWTDPDSVALMVIQTMLGSYSRSVRGGEHMGSSLAQRVAINGIAESITAFNTNYKDTGLFGVNDVAKSDYLGDLAYAIMYEITKLAYRVSEADVARVCNQLKSSLLLNLDGTSQIAEDIGRQLLTYGRRIPLAELFARIDAVDASTIKRVAYRFIHDRDVAISAMGPIQGLPDYN